MWKGGGLNVDIPKSTGIVYIQNFLFPGKNCFSRTFIYKRFDALVNKSGQVNYACPLAPESTTNRYSVI